MREDAAAIRVTSFWQVARPVDRVTWLYILAFGLCVLILGRDDPSWKSLLLIQVGLLAVIAFVLTYWHDHTSGLTGLIRHTYPVMLYTVFYTQAQATLHWAYPGFMDYQIVALEHAIFGVDPNVWLGPLQVPVLNEWMMCGYFSYYLLIPVMTLSLYFRNRIRELHAFLTASTITFVISYVLFVLYPVEGPRYFLAEKLGQPLEGFVFVPLVQTIIERGAIHGGCVPSTHSAIALIVLIWAFRTQRRLAYILAPFIITLFVATVWGHFHYLSDVIIGWTVAGIGLMIADRWFRREPPRVHD